MPLGIRYSTIPIPEPHVVGLVVGAILQRWRPLRFRRSRRSRLGAVLTLAGLGFIATAVRAWGVVPPENDGLVVTGPYRVSRNPMYVGWTLLYVGVAFLANVAWFLVTLPAVLSATHRTITREERELEETFGEEYRTYRDTVPRYLGVRPKPSGVASKIESLP